MLKKNMFEKYGIKKNMRNRKKNDRKERIIGCKDIKNEKKWAKNIRIRKEEPPC